MGLLLLALIWGLIKCALRCCCGRGKDVAAAKGAPIIPNNTQGERIPSWPAPTRGAPTRGAPGSRSGSGSGAAMMGTPNHHRGPSQEDMSLIPGAPPVAAAGGFRTQNGLPHPSLRPGG